jgi:hypothetical protein
MKETPKEKADDLFNKMLNGFQFTIDKYTAIQCSLIAVDEIQNLCWGNNQFGINYWQEVKQNLIKKQKQ